MKTVTSDGIQTLDAPELRRRSAIVVSRLRTCIDVCKRVLLEKFQDTQCDAAGKLSQSIYVVESLLGKCHQEGDLLFFTIRQDPQVSQNNSMGWLNGQEISTLDVSTPIFKSVLFNHEPFKHLGLKCPAT